MTYHRYTVPFLVQSLVFTFGRWFYEVAIIPKNWRMLYSLNANGEGIDGFCWSIGGAGVQEIFIPGLMIG